MIFPLIFEEQQQFGRVSQKIVKFLSDFFCNFLKNISFKKRFIIQWNSEIRTPDIRIPWKSEVIFWPERLEQIALTSEDHF